jgi:excinuclease UvrABC nuclease subunit
MKELKDFEISEFGRPSKPGIYAIWVRNFFNKNSFSHLLYIGSTYNLHSRLLNHKHPYSIALNRFKECVWVSFIETENELRNNEKYLIEKHQPIMNRQWL